MGTPTRRLLDLVAGRPENQMIFTFNSETYYTYFDRLLKTLQWIVVLKNSVNTIVIEKMI